MSVKFRILSLIIGVIMVSLMFSFAMAQAKVTEDKIKAIASQQMSSMLKALESRNYADFSKNFSEQMIKAETTEKFNQLSEKFDKSLGKLLSIDYIGFYLQEPNTVTLFKARYEKSKDDVFIRLVIEFKEESHVVTGLWLN